MTYPTTGASVASADNSQPRGFLPRPLGWRLCSFLELGALPSAVPCARRHARRVARQWGLDKVGDDLELLVSELVTNAIAATRAAGSASPVRMWLLSDATLVAVLVWDASPQPLVRVQVDEAAEGGRGLLLIEAISQQCGWYPLSAKVGKVIWAAL